MAGEGKAMPADDAPEDFQLLADNEGWMKKKSHHVGMWRERYFRFDGRNLDYWSSPKQIERKPRGVIKLNGCRVVGIEDCGFVILGVNGRFDEEFIAKTSAERDSWVSRLNCAALQFRITEPTHDVEVQKFLLDRGLWETLVTAVGDDGAAGLNTLVGKGSISESPGGTAVQDLVREAIIAHSWFGNVLLRFNQQCAQPRQGRLVVHGRRAMQRMRQRRSSVREITQAAQPGFLEDCWMLILSSKNLLDAVANAETKSVKRWPRRRMVPHLTAPFGFPLDFEALHAYSDPQGAGAPRTSLPLSGCHIGSVVQCVDGSGYSVSVEPEEEAQSVWTIVFPSQAAADQWRSVMLAARWSAEARAVGRRRAVAELLAAFDASPEGWHASAGQFLANAAGEAWRPSGDAGGNPLGDAQSAMDAVKVVLEACEDITCEAEDMLDAALQSRPLRRDVCEAVLEGALEPALRCLGQTWLQWNEHLPQGDARAMLRWLDAREYTMQRLGVMCAPLSALSAGLLSELSFRMGGRLRRIMKELLVKELRDSTPLSASAGPGPGRPTPQPAKSPAVSRAPSRASSRAPSPAPSPAIGRATSLPPAASAGAPGVMRLGQRPVSSLPVDLFTMLHSCLPLEQEIDVLPLRINAQRIAKYVVYDVQDAIWQWLLASQPAISTEVRTGSALGLGRGDSVPVTKPTQWFATMIKIANSIPALWAQCREFDDTPLMIARDKYRNLDMGASVVSTQSNFHCPEAIAQVDFDALGMDALPREWGLKAESVRFEAVSEALLWGITDVVTVRFRFMSGDKVPIALSAVLEAEMDGLLHLMHAWMEHLTFEQLLPKVFHICLACCLVRLSRGLRFQDPPGRHLTGEEQLSFNTASLCEFFRRAFAQNNLAKGAADFEDSRGGADALHGVPWLEAPVLNLFRQARTTKSIAKLTLQRPDDGSGPDMSGLVGLLAIVAKTATTALPLPLQEVLRSFGCDRPMLDPFPDLPPAVPPGGTFMELGSRQVATPANRSRPEQISWGGDRLFSAATEGGVCDLRVEDTGAYGVFCNVTRAESFEPVGARAAERELAETRKAEREAREARRGSESVPGRARSSTMDSGVPKAGWMPPRLASNVSYQPGASNVSLSSNNRPQTQPPQSLGGERSAATSAATTPRGSIIGDVSVPLRRRWVQFVKGQPGTVPSLEVLACHPNNQRDNGSDRQEVLALGQLVEVTPTAATSLDLVFITDVAGVDDENFSDDGEFERCITYSVFFDNPSHLLRWRLVLDAWWASEPVKEPRPVTALGSMESAIDIDNCWGNLPGPLTLQSLQERFGSLWQDVKPELQKSR